MHIRTLGVEAPLSAILHSGSLQLCQKSSTDEWPNVAVYRMVFQLQYKQMMQFNAFSKRHQFLFIVRDDFCFKNAL